MREIKAIVRPNMLEKVLHALAAMDELPGVTISDVKGWGRTRGAGADNGVAHAGHAFAKKTKLEIVVNDDQAPLVEEVIARAARTGRPGDGKVFVYDVRRVLRIRTGETGEDGI